MILIRIAFVYLPMQAMSTMGTNENEKIAPVKSALTIKGIRIVRSDFATHDLRGWVAERTVDATSWTDPHGGVFTEAEEAALSDFAQAEDDKVRLGMGTKYARTFDCDVVVIFGSAS